MELVRRHGAALDAKMTTHSLNVNARIRELSLDESLTIAQLNRDNNIARVRAKGEVTVEVERDLKDLRAEEAVWEAETNASRKRCKFALMKEMQRPKERYECLMKYSPVNLKELTLETNFRLKFSHWQQIMMY